MLSERTNIMKYNTYKLKHKNNISYTKVTVIRRLRNRFTVDGAVPFIAEINQNEAGYLNLLMAYANTINIITLNITDKIVTISSGNTQWDDIHYGNISGAIDIIFLAIAL